jgi:uncharacterized protein
MLELNHYKDIHEFWEKYGELIKEHEVDNSLMAANCINMLNEEQEDAFYASVTDPSNNVLLALMVPPYPIVLFGNGTINEEFYNELATYMKETNINLPCIVAPNHLADNFVNRLVENKSYKVKELTKMRFFRLKEVLPAERKPGQLRLAKPEDLPFLKEWVPQAVLEMMGDEIDGEKRALSMIKEERLYLWEDEGQLPVSMVAKTRPTFSDITISMVYTPKEFRKKGYASASVAALSQKLLDEGYRYCTLFTDLANPTANKIYQEIGYEPVIDHYEYDVEKLI